MMRYVGLKYDDPENRGERIGSDRGEDEFKDQPRLIKTECLFDR